MVVYPLPSCESGRASYQFELGVQDLFSGFLVVGVWLGIFLAGEAA
jgi:hypothetical protein